MHATLTTMKFKDVGLKELFFARDTQYNKERTVFIKVSNDFQRYASNCIRILPTVDIIYRCEADEDVEIIPGPSIQVTQLTSGHPVLFSDLPVGAIFQCPDNIGPNRLFIKTSTDVVQNCAKLTEDVMWSKDPNHHVQVISAPNIATVNPDAGKSIDILKHIYEHKAKIDNLEKQLIDLTKGGPVEDIPCDDEDEDDDDYKVVYVLYLGQQSKQYIYDDLYEIDQKLNEHLSTTPEDVKYILVFSAKKNHEGHIKDMVKLKVTTQINLEIETLDS